MALDYHLPTRLLPIGGSGGIAIILIFAILTILPRRDKKEESGTRKVLDIFLYHISVFPHCAILQDIVQTPILLSVSKIFWNFTSPYRRPLPHCGVEPVKHKSLSVVCDFLENNIFGF